MGEQLEKALVIMGSHRNKGGAAEISKWLGEAFKAKGIESEIWHIGSLNIEHCLDCGHCSRHFGSCVIADDMKKVYNAFKAFDYICIVSPVYFNNVTSKLKVLIDRCQMLFMCQYKHQKAFREKPGKGLLISIGGAPSYEDQFRGSEATVSLVFKNLGLENLGHIQIADTDHFAVGMQETKIREEIEQIIGSK